MIRCLSCAEYIKKGNANELEEVLRGSGQEAGSRQDGDGFSPAEAAISTGHGECLRKLIQAKVEMPEIKAHITSFSGQCEVVFQNKEDILRIKDFNQSDIQLLQGDCKVAKVGRKMGIRAL